MTASSCSDRDIENLQTVVKFCEDIESLVERHGSGENDFEENISLQYSCVYALIQIGEHVKRLSSDLRGRWPDIKRKNIINMRDFVVHNYARIGVPILRTTVLADVPDLKEK
ncbi:MAG: DUF86 domain-containing protein, partial [Methanomassiliicoccaceae archaeon]|nr:DUF86 domain-containing protein [Methanomassiliicoccaceae archaeon]